MGIARRAGMSSNDWRPLMTPGCALATVMLLVAAPSNYAATPSRRHGARMILPESSPVAEVQ